MTDAKSAQKIQHTQHPWAHILWRDRLTVLMVMVIMLLIALGLIAYLPRDYVATSIITASPTGVPNATNAAINWGAEADFVRSDAVMHDTHNQLSPVQSTKQFQPFRPLKLPEQMHPAPAPNTKNAAHDWQNKLFVFVHYNPQQNPSGLRIETRSSNPAEAAQLAHVVAESYMRARSDIAAKDTAQKNAWIRTELLKKRKYLIEAQALYTQYYRENGLILSAEKDAATDRAISIDEAKAEIAANATRYGPKHPIMVELNARLTSFEMPIKTDDTQPTLVQQTLDQLMQDVQTARGDVDQFIKQHGAGLSSTPTVPDRIVLRAGKISIRPDHRFDRALIGLFALCGLVLGMFIVAMRHLIRPTLQSPHDVPRAVAVLPRIGVLRATNDQKQFTDGASIMAFKTMRHEVRLRFKEPKLVVITSDVSNITPLHMGLGLARATAKAGEKSIIIEANWHHAHLHNIVPNHKNRTLIDYVAGSASLESILNRDDPSGMHILYGGDIPMTAVDLLSGTKFSNLLLSFRQIYDLVVLIAPPVAQGADTRILSRMADLTVLTMVADGSHPASLSAAVSTLQEAKITDIATLWVE